MKDGGSILISTAGVTAEQTNSAAASSQQRMGGPACAYR